MSDLLNNFFWAIERVLIDVLKALSQISLGGSLTLTSLYQNAQLQEIFNCMVVMMFVFLPIKLVCEICIENINPHQQVDLVKKLVGCVLAAILTFSLRIGWSDILLNTNNITRLIGVNDQQFLAKNMLINLYSTFGGMNEKQAKLFYKAYDQNLNAKDLKQTHVSSKWCKNCTMQKGKRLWKVDEMDTPGFSINQRFVNKHESLNYVWEHSSFLCILGLLYLVAMMILMNLQVAMRSISLVLYFLLFPLNATCLSKGVNNNAFFNYCKTIGVLLLTNIMQVLMLYLAPILLKSVFASEQSLYLRMIFLLAINHHILQIPQIMAQMFGGMVPAPLIYSPTKSPIGQSFSKALGEGALAVAETPLDMLYWQYLKHREFNLYSTRRSVPWHKR